MASQGGTPKVVDYFVDVNEPNEIKEICINHVPQWNELSNDSLSVRKYLSPFSNHVFKVEVENSSRTMAINRVLVKLKPTDTSDWYEFDSQYTVLKALGEHGCGPIIIQKTDKFMIQEWLEGDVLESDLLRRFSVFTSIGTLLARFHKHGTRIAPEGYDRTPLMTKMLNKWSPIVRENMGNEKLEGLDLNDIFDSLDKYKKLLLKFEGSNNEFVTTIRLCHNDMYYKNVIDSKHSLRLIDFDTVGFNYIGFDIAKLFYETNIWYAPGIPPQFRDDKPLSHEWKVIFSSLYLSELLEKDIPPSDIQTIEKFMEAIEIHTLGNYIYWMFRRIVILVSSEFEVYGGFIKGIQLLDRLRREQIGKLVEKGFLQK
ncbi:choline/ethanolamine kinase, putative [Theileria equi strain WA]|uniref:Choline/ethanolamine kinase, putative n=1 Tax=Theileria equi strain WA TaxID=1537102 RepID=L0ATG4_THEEQ|nr:choline/ethanolamine kinase, putative [Theileria equi strain WA]AFZ78927.1 choline/ethanolamine kinase, putative [Theileria equi strain WA]|eukprot:XP_004828593.1 choline/ethanolamine kinase, putative [Theileria equi strain WA]